MKNLVAKIIRSIVVTTPFLVSMSFAGVPGADCIINGGRASSGGIASGIFGAGYYSLDIVENFTQLSCNAEPGWSPAAPSSPQPRTVVLKSIAIKTPYDPVNGTSPSPGSCELVVLHPTATTPSRIKNAPIPLAHRGEGNFNLDATQAPNGVALTAPDSWFTASTPNLRYKSLLVCLFNKDSSFQTYTTVYQ